MTEGKKQKTIYVPIRFPASLLEKAISAAAERWPDEDRSGAIIRIVEQWLNALEGNGRHALVKEVLKITEEQHGMLILLLDAHGLEWNEYRGCDNPPGSE